MLASAACFVANVLLVRALGTLGSANVWLIAVARFVVGLAMIVAVYGREFQPTHLWRNRKLIERGLVGGAGSYVTYLTIIKLGAGRATFIGNTYIIWGAFLAAWWLKEKLRPATLTGGAAALVGLALLTNVFSSSNPPGIYDALAVLASLMSAHVVVTIRQLHDNEHTSTIFAAQCTYGLLLCGVPAIVTFESINPIAWAVLLVASVIVGAGQLMLTRAFRDLPVAEGSLIQILVPLGIAVGGVVFFHEHFSLHELLGAALILAGCAFTALRRDAKPTPPENE
ncbi:MAG TPA: DMT family transporter [Acidobacteriota bacterium]|nr:DMT family transporter [Acidobacteriota bacterium]